MKILYQRCAGLDVHSAEVVCALRVVKGRRVNEAVRSFGTTTQGLLKLADWLEEQGVTHVVMEATGVYWKPVWHVLEGRFKLVLANAQEVHNVPGRKSDVSDAAWLADLLAHGLVRGSMVPPEPILELRDLTRTRKQLVREVVQHVQRIQKTLEDANIKLTEVVSDVMGSSGQAILNALIAGQTDAQELARLAHPRLQTPHDKLVEALRGRVRAHHRFMLSLHLDQIRALEASIRRIEERMAVAIEPFRQSIDLLTTMPGISRMVAQVIVAEIGVEMTRFPTAGHLVSWAGLCPRMDQSAGKRRCTRIRKGNAWLKTALVQSAWAAIRVKNSYLGAQFHRLRGRRGPKKAIVAVAASMLTAAYFMLKHQAPYQDLGHDYFQHKDKDAIVRRLARRIRELGYQVEVHAA
jgi:transposase